MCLATPVQIKQITKDRALLKNGGEAGTVLVDDLKKGDWVLVSHKMVVGKISALEAQEILKLVRKCEHSHNSQHEKGG